MTENIAHFRILDLKVPIGINEYHDLGYVKDIETINVLLNYKYGIVSKINIEANNQEILKNSKHLGDCIYYTKSNIKLPKTLFQNNIKSTVEFNKYLSTIKDVDIIIKMEAYICYINQEIITQNRNLTIASKYSNIATRAHEETHALHVLGKLSYLEDALLNKQNVKIDLNNIENEEVIANIGSMYAINTHQVEKIESENSKGKEIFIELKNNASSQFKEAFEIYTNLKSLEKII